MRDGLARKYRSRAKTELLLQCRHENRFLEQAIRIVLVEKPVQGAGQRAGSSLNRLLNGNKLSSKLAASALSRLREPVCTYTHPRPTQSFNRKPEAVGWFP